MFKQVTWILQTFSTLVKELLKLEQNVENFNLFAHFFLLNDLFTHYAAQPGSLPYVCFSSTTHDPLELM